MRTSEQILSELDRLDRESIKVNFALEVSTVCSLVVAVQDALALHPQYAHEERPTAEVLRVVLNNLITVVGLHSPLLARELRQADPGDPLVQPSIN